jgi:hypothetical protein
MHGWCFNGGMREGPRMAAQPASAWSASPTRKTGPPAARRTGPGEGDPEPSAARARMRRRGRLGRRGAVGRRRTGPAEIEASSDGRGALTHGMMADLRRRDGGHGIFRTDNMCDGTRRFARLRDGLIWSIGSKRNMQGVQTGSNVELLPTVPDPRVARSSTHGGPGACRLPGGAHVCTREPWASAGKPLALSKPRAHIPAGAAHQLGLGLRV